MSAPVFLAEPGTLGGLTAGTVYVLDGDEGRHAAVVQRRRPGERVDVVDGAGVRLRSRIETIAADGVHLVVVDVVLEPPAGPTLTLAQALAKGDRDELAIEAATEVGVDVVLPWQADRSVVVWRGERAAKSRMRWIGTVRAATKQARRSRVPVVEAAVDSAGLVARVAAVVAAGGLVLVLHEEADEPLTALTLPGDGERVEVLIVVGPEGGITSDELAALTGAGARIARLGPWVLRTSTAGPVALAVLATRLGRWG